MARITAADGGFYLRAQKSAAAAVDGYVKLTSSEIDFTDETKVFALDMKFAAPTLTATNDKLAAGLSNSTSIVGDDSHLAQMKKDGAADFPIRSLRTIAASSDVGSDQNSQAAEWAFVVRLIVYKNQVVDGWVQAGTTYLSGFPTASASVFKLKFGTPAVSVGSDTGIYGTPFYAAFEALAGGGASGDASGVLTHVRLQEYA